MRIAAISDIHGNALALRAVLDDAKARGYDQMVQVGDALSGPLWPRETADILRGLDAAHVRGNHDVSLYDPDTYAPGAATCSRASGSTPTRSTGSAAGRAPTRSAPTCSPSTARRTGRTSTCSRRRRPATRGSGRSPTSSTTWAACAHA